MSDYDRGPYSPGAERPLSFDGRRARRPAGPAPVTLILSLMLLAGVGGGVFYVYRGGVRGAGDAPRPVGAPVGDIRSAAPPQIQAPDPAAGLSIYKDNPNEAARAPAFVPPPEQPTPRPTPSPTLAVAAAPPAPAAVAVPAARKLAVAPAAEPVKPAPSAKPVGAKSVAVKSPSAKAAAARPTEAAKPTSIGKLLADDAAPPTKSDLAADASAKPGPASVQIGAFSSRDLADAGWNDAAGLAPGDMAGRNKRVTAVTKADGSTLYRAAITGFASRAEAQALCARLKAAGQSCLVK
jgi:hypothetical protein